MTWRRWGPNLVLAVVAAVLSLLLAEGVLRAVWTVERVTLVHDPLLGFRGRGGAETIWTREMAGQPRRVRLNAEGYHDHERSRDKPAATWRVVFMGDSFLEAYQVDVDSSFAQRLGRRWSRRAAPRGRTVEAVNQGVHGYGLGVHALSVRQRLPAWHPDAVVLCLFLGNDLHDNFTPVASTAVPRFHLDRSGIHGPRAAGTDAGPSPALVYVPAPAADARTWMRDQVLARSALVRFVWMRLIKSSAGAMDLARAAGMVSTPDLASDAQGRTAQMTAVAARLLARIADDLRDRGVPLFVFVIPDPFLVNDLAVRMPSGQPPDPGHAERVAVEAATLAALRDLDLPYVYPRAAFLEDRRQDRGAYRNGFGHFTDAAHREVAELLEEPIWRTWNLPQD